jgi:hypothetical protein
MRGALSVLGGTMGNSPSGVFLSWAPYSEIGQVYVFDDYWLLFGA